MLFTILKTCLGMLGMYSYIFSYRYTLKLSEGGNDNKVRVNSL